MPDESGDIVTVRLAVKDREAIARLVEEGAFRNRSDFLRYAVKATLAEHAGSGDRTRVRAELDLEGIELPAPEVDKRRRGGRSLRGGLGR